MFPPGFFLPCDKSSGNDAIHREEENIRSKFIEVLAERPAGFKKIFGK